ncbi:MAG: diguanylate cyclase [Gammaproteobacteria bacterium]|nr:diguanylate cyclase [Gammaproteobacteria bacterium]
MTVLINDCKTAELHLIGKIQPCGALLAIDRTTDRIAACSENASIFLMRDVKDLIGNHWSDFFHSNDISMAAAEDDPELYLPTITESVLNDTPVVISSHPRGPFIIVEIETRSDEAVYEHSDRLRFLQRLAAMDTPDGAARLLMQSIARITGFDRVMLYKFMPDWHGKVIDEQNKPGVQGFLGLHFPAADIPENARRLYAVNMQRIIVDVTASDVNIVAADEVGALDLTYSQLRAVHPVHIQYLQNIGARTSFSVSIKVAGNLWGMVACHHLQLAPIGFRRRFLCEELARTVSLQMSGLMALEAERSRSEFFAVKSTILAALRMNASLSASFNVYATQLLKVFAADGIWFNVDGQDLRYGVVARIDALAVLNKWLAQLDDQEVFHTSRIARELQMQESLVKHASGMLYIPLGKRGFVVFCRNEQKEDVQWAGNDRNSASGNCEAQEFTPRKSFDKWSELVVGRSFEWQETELESAARLREVLIDHLERTELEQLALQDGLTGLANRTMFENELKNAIQVSKSKVRIVAVFMLDLDKFKPVNDTWGHAAGDELLIQVGERLKKLVRGRDVVARFGGDEFAVILYHFVHLDEVRNVASRIIEELHNPFRLEEAEVQIGASLGIALFPEHAAEPQELMEKADAALYEVKRSGRNAWRFYDTDIMPLGDRAR